MDDMHFPCHLCCMRERRATIIDVARAAGRSTATVSNAITGRRQVDPGTRQLVLDVASRLGYTPDPRAQRLRMGDARSLALLSSMPLSISAGPSRLGFFMEVAAAIAVEAMQEGLALMLVPPPERACSSRMPERLDIDGAFVIEPEQDDPIVDRLRSRHVPIVCIGRQPGPAEQVPLFVDLHPARTTGMLMAHLQAEGARRIGLVIGAQSRSSYLDAEAAYRRIAPHPLVLRLDETGGEAVATQAIHQLLAGHPEIDGLCVPVDVFAVAALSAACLLGRRVPDDLRIATRYDGIRARSATIPLTAIDLGLDETARMAVSLMLAVLRGSPPPVCAGAAASLVVRGSTRSLLSSPAA